MKQLGIFFFFFTIISCKQQNVTGSETKMEATEVNIDSLSSVFLAGWNTKDSAAIMNTIADNAIVMNDSLIHKGITAIATHWVSGGVKVLSNIKTSSVIQGGSGNTAYAGGTYTLDLTPPGGPVLKERGNYTLVWERQQTEEWKLTLIHIEDVTRLPDIR